VTGALRRYLEEKGDSTVGAELRVIVPVNLRPSGDEPALGNRVGSISVLLPLGMDDPSARVREVHRRLSALKGSYEPSFMLGAFNLLGHAPYVIQRTLLPWMSWRATAVMTMVPGPRDPLAHPRKVSTRIPRSLTLTKEPVGLQTCALAWSVASKYSGPTTRFGGVPRQVRNPASPACAP